MFWAMLGMNAASSLLSFGAQSAQAKAQRAWQAYSNTMVRLSDAQNQNAITTNEVLAMKASTEESIDIQKDFLQSSASAEVAAAAAGVTGRSVSQAMFDIQRSANLAQSRREESLRNQFLSFDAQRKQSTMSAAMQQDHSYIPKPSLASSLLQAGINSAQYWGK